MFTIGIGHKKNLLGLVSWDTQAQTQVGVQTFSTQRRTLQDLYDSVFHYVASRGRQGKILRLALCIDDNQFSARLAGYFTVFAAEFGTELIELQWVDEQRAAKLLSEHHREPAVIDALAAALAAVPVEGKRGLRCR